ncbi:hypothetical protein L9F63_003742, partial [Diploptera punctata]
LFHQYLNFFTYYNLHIHIQRWRYKVLCSRAFPKKRYERRCVLNRHRFDSRRPIFFVYKTEHCREGGVVMKPYTQNVQDGYITMEPYSDEEYADMHCMYETYPDRRHPESQHTDCSLQKPRREELPHKVMFCVGVFDQGFVDLQTFSLPCAAEGDTQELLTIKKEILRTTYLYSKSMFITIFSHKLPTFFLGAYINNCILHAFILILCRIVCEEHFSYTLYIAEVNTLAYCFEPGIPVGRRTRLSTRILALQLMSPPIDCNNLKQVFSRWSVVPSPKKNILLYAATKLDGLFVFYDFDFEIVEKHNKTHITNNKKAIPISTNNKRPLSLLVSYVSSDVHLVDSIRDIVEIHMYLVESTIGYPRQGNSRTTIHHTFVGSGILMCRTPKSGCLLQYAMSEQEFGELTLSKRRIQHSVL